MQNKITWSLVLLFFLAALLYSFNLGSRLDHQHPFDLRNRVVGARLIKDGKLPYFYKWEKADGLRYYDPLAFNGLRVTNITATPFFHQLFSPIVDLPEREISRLWLYIEYALILLCMLLALALAKEGQQYKMVLLAGSLFLLTEAWYSHLGSGQYYILIPFLGLLFYWLINRQPAFLTGIAAGTVAIVLILIRPNCLIFFIPFAGWLFKNSRQYRLAFIIPGIAALIWISSSPFERMVWLEFKNAVSENVQFHQGLKPMPPPGVSGPGFSNWEGIDEKEISNDKKVHPVNVNSENGNVFVIYKHVFGRMPNLNALVISSIIIIIALLAFFYYQQTKLAEASLLQLALFGFCLYMITDLWSPIHRHQYYTIQWLFPVLLVAANYKYSQKWVCLFLLMGLLLNIGSLPFIKMEHTIGEYLIFGTLLFYSLYRPPTPQL